MPAIDTRYGILQHKKNKSTNGYTLFTPLGQYNTYLIDMDGEVVHKWDLPSDVGNYAYLLENGNLLAAIRTKEQDAGLPAKGGRLVEYDWDGKIIWEHNDPLQHHDFRRKKNGNTIYAAWVKQTDPMILKSIPGGMPGTENDGAIYTDVIREVDPNGKLVWEWDVLENMDMTQFPIDPTINRREYAHANTVALTLDGDVIVNWRNNNTMIIIDRDTKEIKWSLNDTLYGQHHDVQMLDNGNILFFANGADVHVHGPETGSRVIEINPISKKEVWSYSGTPPRSFMSWFISGCQRLSSGNTLICEGLWGRLFEVTPDHEIVWEYVSPYFVEYDHPAYTGTNIIFRCYRYAADSKQVRGRLS
ncbi:MAG: aryl sulfotransferase [Rhodospirillaceae bacterium]|nr:aryl sulfotransferase [Rhodospirillaceae bacterium]OUT76530.1 MAG: hypothetical protein CBB83_10830 [Rhodospirillaceae bacterium TMED23]